MPRGVCNDYCMQLRNYQHEFVVKLLMYRRWTMALESRTRSADPRVSISLSAITNASRSLSRTL